MTTSTAKTLKNASEKCKASGAKLTEKRKRTLSLLLDATKPLSAYELIDQYKNQFGESLTAMSAYRMLNFLVDESLAHKLELVNKYTVCKHINCDHNHELSQFLICDTCHVVSEVSIKDNILQKLKDDVSEIGFKLSSRQLELHGTCHKCANA